MTEQKFLCTNPFPDDSYDTPEDTPRSIWEYLFLGTRLSFYIRNYYIFSRSGWLASHTDFTAETQTIYALKNMRITESCGGRVHLRGLDNIMKPGRPSVIIANHMSMLETAFIHAFLRPRSDFCFVIKESLLNVPFFGDIMRKLGCIAVTRQNPRDDFRKVLEEGKKRLEQGKCVILFPQHSRSEVFNEQQFNTIGVKLAKHADAPIIPMALRTDFMSNGKWIRDMGPIRRERPIWFVFGEPIMKVRGSGKEEHRQIMDFIESHLRSWGCKYTTGDPE